MMTENNRSKLNRWYSHAKEDSRFSKQKTLTRDAYSTYAMKHKTVIRNQGILPRYFGQKRKRALWVVSYLLPAAGSELWSQLDRAQTPWNVEGTVKALIGSNFSYLDTLWALHYCNPEQTFKPATLLSEHHHFVEWFGVIHVAACRSCQAAAL